MSAPVRLKVRPIRAANGRIQGWAIEDPAGELGFRRSHSEAMNVAQAIIRGADCTLFQRGHCSCRWECGR